MRSFSVPSGSEVGNPASGSPTGARRASAAPKHFGLFANLRPAVCFPALTHASPVKEDRIAGGSTCSACVNSPADSISASPRGSKTRDGEETAVDTMVYKKSEIVRIARVAFSAAEKRGGKLCSIDKANVLQNGLLWRRTVEEVAKEFPR